MQLVEATLWTLVQVGHEVLALEARPSQLDLLVPMTPSHRAPLMVLPPGVIMTCIVELHATATDMEAPRVPEVTTFPTPNDIARSSPQLHQLSAQTQPLTLRP